MKLLERLISIVPLAKVMQYSVHFLRLKVALGIEAVVGAIAARNNMRDLARKVFDLKLCDSPTSAFAGKNLRPGIFDADAERRQQSQSCDDDASH